MPDPLQPTALIDGLAGALAARYRVISLSPRRETAYQVAGNDVLGMLQQFGFAAPVLAAEGLGCAAALIVAAWYPGRVAGVALIDATYSAPPGDSLEARALRDCPPDWPGLIRQIRCPVLDVRGTALSLVADIEAFLAATLP
ncbi:MAG TPA: alpha/beta hydrolase [Chloroflexota bacterium]